MAGSRIPNALYTDSEKARYFWSSLAISSSAVCTEGVRIKSVGLHSSALHILAHVVEVTLAPAIALYKAFVETPDSLDSWLTVIPVADVIRFRLGIGYTKDIHERTI